MEKIKYYYINVKNTDFNICLVDHLGEKFYCIKEHDKTYWQNKEEANDIFNSIKLFKLFKYYDFTIKEELF